MNFILQIASVSAFVVGLSGSPRMDVALAKVHLSQARHSIAPASVETLLSWDAAANGPLLAACMTHDSRHVMWGTQDGRLVLWQRKSGTQTITMAHRQRTPATQPTVYAADFSPDGRVLAVSWTDGKNQIWNLDERNLIKEWQDNVVLKAIRFGPTGQFLGAGGVDGSVSLLRAKDWVRVWSQDFERPDSIAPGGYSLDFYPDGSKLVTLIGTQIKVRDTSSGRLLASFEAGGAMHAQVHVSPDGRFLATAGCHKAPPFNRGVVYVWDAAEFRLLRKFTLTKDSLVHSYAFSPDARVLFCIGADKALYASELASGTGFILVGPETLNGGAMSLSKFGKYMLSHERRGEILLWNLGKLSGEPTALSAAEATNAWELLADDNVKLAQAAIRDLSASGKIALRIIREQVKPEIQIDERKIAQLIDDLVSPDFPTRKRAAEALIACGVVAEKALRSALAKDAPLELQRTGAEILVHIGQQTLTGRPLQSVRAIEILERIGTPEAVAVLETLSKGERRAFQTKAALWALERLKKSSER